MCVEDQWASGDVFGFKTVGKLSKFAGNGYCDVILRVKLSEFKSRGLTK